MDTWALRADTRSNVYEFPGGTTREGSCHDLVDPLSPRTGRTRAAHHAHAPPRRVAPDRKDKGAPCVTFGGTSRGVTTGAIPASAATFGGIEPSQRCSRTASARSATGAVLCTSRIRKSSAATTAAHAKACTSPRLRGWSVWSPWRDDGPQEEPRRGLARMAPPSTTAPRRQGRETRAVHLIDVLGGRRLRSVNWRLRSSERDVAPPRSHVARRGNRRPLGRFSRVAASSDLKPGGWRPFLGGTGRPPHPPQNRSDAAASKRWALPAKRPPLTIRLGRVEVVGT